MVIVIIGILAAIAIPSIGGFRDKAGEAVKQTAEAISRAIEVLVADGTIDIPKDETTITYNETSEMVLMVNLMMKILTLKL